MVEFFTGDALFQTHDNLEHLAMMEAVCGKKIDTHLIQQVNNICKRNNSMQANKYVYSTGSLCVTNARDRYFKRLKLDYPQPDTSKASRRFVKAMKHLEVC